MENKIQVAEARVNGDWANLKTVDGKEVSVMLSKCPKLKEAIEQAMGKNLTTFDLDCKVVSKNDKIYAWDLEEKKPFSGGFKGQPKDEGMIVAQSTLGYACNFYAQRSGVSEDMIFALSEKMIAFVKKHSTLNK